MLDVPDFAAMQQRELDAARVTIRADADAAKRAAAARTLGDGTASDLPLLSAALQDTSPRVRRATVDALRKLDETARPAGRDVLSALQMEKDADTAVAMGWLLYRWDVDLQPATASLRAVMAGPDALYRYHAAQLLQPLVDAREVLPVYVETLGTAIGKNASNKPEALLEELIPSSGAAIWPLLEKAVGDSNAARRAACATLSARFKPFPAAGEKLLIAYLQDADPAVRAAAAWSCLMAEPEPIGAGPVLRPLLKDPDPDVRAKAARALGQFAALGRAPAGTVEALGERMSDGSPPVREDTARALQSIRDKPEPVVRQLLARMDPRVETEATVRAAAAAALLYASPTPDVKTALRRGFDDSDETVRERCLSMAGHLRVSDREILEAIAARTGPAYGKGERLNALGALRDLGAAALPVKEAVLRALQDPDPDLREGAGYAAQQMGLSTAVP